MTTFQHISFRPFVPLQSRQWFVFVSFGKLTLQFPFLPLANPTTRRDEDANDELKFQKYRRMLCLHREAGTHGFLQRFYPGMGPIGATHRFDVYLF